MISSVYPSLIIVFLSFSVLSKPTSLETLIKKLSLLSSLFIRTSLHFPFIFFINRSKHSLQTCESFAFLFNPQSIHIFFVVKTHSPFLKPMSSIIYFRFFLVYYFCIHYMSLLIRTSLHFPFIFFINRSKHSLQTCESFAFLFNPQSIHSLFVVTTHSPFLKTMSFII